MQKHQMRKVVKMNVRISKMQRELAKLYDERANKLNAVKKRYPNASIELDFPTYVIEEIVKQDKQSVQKVEQRPRIVQDIYR
jgi:hypothetical protein